MAKRPLFQAATGGVSPRPGTSTATSRRVKTKRTMAKMTSAAARRLY
jgi:hypothetical protein